MPQQKIRLLPSALVAAFLFAGPAPAQPPATAPVARPTPIITREDLATAYVRVERAVHEAAPRGRQRAAAHRAMDQAVYRFFTGDHSAAIRIMNELSDALERGDAGDAAADAGGEAGPPSDWKSIVRSMRVRVAPRIANIHRPSIFNVRISPLYPVAIEQPLELRLVVREDRPGGKVIFDHPVTIQGDGPLPSISTQQPQAAPGTYRVELVDARGEAIEVGRWFVVDQSLETLRAAHERLLGAVEITDFQMFQALVACRSRNALLSDRPSEAESSQFLPNPIQLLREVQEEVAALRQGIDPYAGRRGDYWRAIPAGAMHIPARIYAPEQVKQDRPMPLVIALHGAGADENAFIEACGAGAIKRLADAHGFVVVTPSTYWVMPNPEALAGIVETLSLHYPIDPSRIYLVGHSLGALAAAGIATRHPDDVAAAVLIAGGKLPPRAKICPTLIVAAELDPIVPPHQLEGTAARAQEEGQPVEFRLMRDAGHALVVAEALPEAIAWLLEHRAAAKPK